MWIAIGIVLLIAVAVVATVYLYPTSPSKSPPPAARSYTLSLTGPVPSNTTGPRAAHYISYNISTSGAVNTTMFGLKLANATGAAIAIGTVPGQCTATGAPTFTTNGCRGPSSGWYVVLEGPTGTILATFGLGGNWSAPAVVNLSSSDVLVLISDGGGPANLPLYGTGDVLTAYGVRGYTVSGTVTL